MARSVTLLLLAALTLVTSVALARPSRVVLIRSADPALQEAVTRTRAELAVEGFEVVLAEAPAGGDVRAQLSSVAKRERAIAAISFSAAREGAAADLWITDRVTDKTVVRTVRVDDVPVGERPRALAIRAVELLRASLVEAVADETRDQVPRRVPEDATRFVEGRAPLDGVGFQLGVALLTSFADVGPAGAPAARISWGHDSGFGARVSVVAPAFGARPTGPLGSASVRQELGTIDAFFAPDLGDFVALGWGGVGVLHVTAEGDLVAPVMNRTVERWVPAFQLGAGLGYRLTPHLFVLLDAAAVLTAPRVDITAQGTELGSLGQPSLLASLGVAASF